MNMPVKLFVASAASILMFVMTNTSFAGLIHTTYNVNATGLTDPIGSPGYSFSVTGTITTAALPGAALGASNFASYNLLVQEATGNVAQPPITVASITSPTSSVQNTVTADGVSSVSQQLDVANELQFVPSASLSIGWIVNTIGSTISTTIIVINNTNEYDLSNFVAHTYKVGLGESGGHTLTFGGDTNFGSGDPNDSGAGFPVASAVVPEPSGLVHTFVAMLSLGAFYGLRRRYFMPA